jgi:hypothetical protein
MNHNTDRLDRRAQIETKARQYARSGAHFDYRTIKAVLMKQGYLETEKLFTNAWTRQELNRICEQACGRDKRSDVLLRLVHSVSS